MLSDLEKRVRKLVAERDVAEKQLEVVRTKREIEEESIKHTKEARGFITEIARQTQQNFADTVEKLVTLTIRPVFRKNIEFKLYFETKANRTQCVPMVREGEWEYSPKEEDGGSVIDMIGFALRVALWSLSRDRSRPVIVIDEPFNMVGKEELERTGAVVRELSEKLGFQIIMNTHERELAQIAHRAFYVEREGYESRVVTKTAHVSSVQAQIEKPMKKKRVIRRKRLVRRKK